MLLLGLHIYEIFHTPYVTPQIFCMPTINSKHAENGTNIQTNPIKIGSECHWMITRTAQKVRVEPPERNSKKKKNLQVKSQRKIT